jgi:thiamine biosynthesis protein ThiI
VAAWLAMKRGIKIVALFMDPSPLVDERTFQRAMETIKRLTITQPIKTYVAHYGDVLISILNKGGKLGCILCKRMMYRVAEIIAEKEGANAIITGESLGQVASQTMQNIHVIEKAVKIPVIRPLIGLDKEEIVSIAKKIGTYEASILPANCCLGPPLHPETKASLRAVLKAEEGLEAEKLAGKMAESANYIIAGS